jgi:hypothetical protein
MHLQTNIASFVYIDSLNLSKQHITEFVNTFYIILIKDKSISIYHMFSCNI